MNSLKLAQLKNMFPKSTKRLTPEKKNSPPDQTPTATIAGQRIHRSSLLFGKGGSHSACYLSEMAGAVISSERTDPVGLPDGLRRSERLVNTP